MIKSLFGGFVLALLIFLLIGSIIYLGDNSLNNDLIIYDSFNNDSCPIGVIRTTVQSFNETHNIITETKCQEKGSIREDKENV